jgi:hypothetical protein
MQLASPKWTFHDATFARSAAAFDNPDHVAIVIHNYRWRLSLAAGESQYDDLERPLASFPAIAVPTITLEGDVNGAPHPDATAYASRFTGKYQSASAPARGWLSPATAGNCLASRLSSPPPRPARYAGCTPAATGCCLYAPDPPDADRWSGARDRQEAVVLDDRGRAW